MREILFMGEVLASVTHEMQNVMAIIKESGALVDDIFVINGRPAMKFGDKLDSALVNIQEQVGRGRNLMLMLNGFAHAASNYPEQSDLLRFARQICTLADRMARLRECRLVVELEGEPLPVMGNALMLMQTIYRAVEVVLAACRPGDTIHVRAGRKDMYGLLQLTADKGGEHATTADCSLLSGLIAEQNWECHAEQGALELRFPLAPALGGQEV